MIATFSQYTMVMAPQGKKYLKFKLKSGKNYKNLFERLLKQQTTISRHT